MSKTHEKQFRQARRALDRAAKQLATFAKQLPTIALRRSLYDIECDLRFAHQATKPEATKP